MAMKTGDKSARMVELFKELQEIEEEMKRGHYVGIVVVFDGDPGSHLISLPQFALLAVKAQLKIKAVDVKDMTDEQFAKAEELIIKIGEDFKRDQKTRGA